MDLISREAVLDGIDKYIEKAQSTGTKDDFISFAELGVKGLPSAFEGMTNGDVVKAVFPNAKVSMPKEPILPISNVIVDYDENHHNFYRWDWWDSPYKGVSE